MVNTGLDIPVRGIQQLRLSRAEEGMETSIYDSPDFDTTYDFNASPCWRH